MHRHEPGEVYHVLEGAFTFYVDRSRPATTHRTVATARRRSSRWQASTPAHGPQRVRVVEAVAFGVHAPGAVMGKGVRPGRRRLPPPARRPIQDVLAIAQQNGIESSSDPCPRDWLASWHDR